LPSTLTPPANSSGGSSPARRRCEGSASPCCRQEAYGGQKDVNEAWAAGVLAVGTMPAAAAQQVAALVQERLAWVGLQAPGAAP